MSTPSIATATPRLARRNRRRWWSLLVATLLTSAGLSAGTLEARAAAEPAPMPASTDTVVDLLPTADAYVSSRYPTENFGQSTSLIVDNSPQRHSFLRFDLSAYPAASLLSATLTLTTESNTSGGRQDLHLVADDAWTESGLTWDNQPAVGATVGSLTSTARATAYAIPLPVDAVAGKLGGDLSLGLDSPSTDGLWIDSRESAAPPVLRLDLAGGGGGTAPDTLITSAPQSQTTSTTATFAFSASDPTSTFECQLDAGAFGACTSPTTYHGLGLGNHTFAVRATDSAGNVDPTPAVATWTVVSVPAGSTDITLAAVGDINDSGNSSTTSRAGLTATSIRNAGVDAVALLGDWQYEHGDCADLVSYFDQTGWGALMPKIIATAGPTHDWSSATDTTGYQEHVEGTCPGQTSSKTLSATAWGSNVGPGTPHWVDLGAWRVFSVSSGLWRYDTAAAQATTTWLDTQIGAAVAAGDHPLVIWHEPYWTSASNTHSSTEGDYSRPWIDVLDKWNVPLVLSGHQHGYARFYPQDANGTRDDASGTQQLIVGTGGMGLYSWTDRAPNLVTQEADTWGWLKLTLHPDGHYAWQFEQVAGAGFTDSGTR